jgi:hypothetical protein
MKRLNHQLFNRKNIMAGHFLLAFKDKCTIANNHPNESIAGVKELMSIRCLLPVKKACILILIAGIFLNANAQDKLNSYKWQQYGIEIITEENLEIVEADQDKFRCDGEECNLWINKLSSPVSSTHQESYLQEGIVSRGLGKAGQIKKEIRDSLSIISVRVENNKSYGFVFVLQDTLRNNNCFFGYMSTGSKPRINMMSLLDFKLFQGDLSIKPLASKSAQTMMDGFNSEHELIRSYTSSDTLLIGKDKIKEAITDLYETYSPDITKMMKFYESLPETFGARKIATHVDISNYFNDSLDMKWLFINSTFAHEMYHNIVSWMSIVQSIKKTRGNYSDKYYSYYLSDTCIINVEKHVETPMNRVPPSNIIQRTFPPIYRGNVYSLYIYPSNLTNSTQMDGIYALLNEFGANIEELVWYNDILQYYFDKKMNNVIQLGNYITNSTNSFSDCIQFYQYILHYLLTVQQTMPDYYAKLAGDSNFKRIIVLMEQKLNDQISKYNLNKHKISDMLANEYIGFLENETELIINNNSSWSNSDLNKLDRQIDYINTQPDYQRITADIGAKPCNLIDFIKE